MGLEDMTIADLERLLVEAQRHVEAAEKRRDSLREVVEAIRKATPHLYSAVDRAPAETDPGTLSVEEGRRARGFGAIPGEERVHPRRHPTLS